MEKEFVNYGLLYNVKVPKLRVKTRMYKCPEKLSKNVKRRKTGLNRCRQEWGDRGEKCRDRGEAGEERPSSSSRGTLLNLDTGRGREG